MNECQLRECRSGAMQDKDSSNNNRLPPEVSMVTTLKEERLPCTAWESPPSPPTSPLAAEELRGSSWGFPGQLDFRKPISGPQTSKSLASWAERKRVPTSTERLRIIHFYFTRSCLRLLREPRAFSFQRKARLWWHRPFRQRTGTEPDCLCAKTHYDQWDRALQCLNLSIILTSLSDCLH